MNQPVHVKSNGTIEKVQPANGKKFTLEELQKYAGGWIEMVRLDPLTMMVVDEEGKLKGLPRNTAAEGMTNGHIIVGDVLITPMKFLE